MELERGESQVKGAAQDQGQGEYRSGFITIMGRPNAGKSTLLNALSGEYLAIVSPKAQTTRHSIRYIYTDDEAQCIFVDTPGVHKPQHKLGDYMMNSLKESLDGADIVLLVLDAGKGRLNSHEEELIQSRQRQGRPLILALNKVDSLPKEKLLPIMAQAQALGLTHIVPISALKAQGLELLLREVKALLPPGPLYYDPEDFTDQSERKLAEELVREKILRNLYEEIPHGTGVLIQKFEEFFSGDAEPGDQDSEAACSEAGAEPGASVGASEAETGGDAEPRRRKVRISADILCDRESHKKILIGQGASMLKRIRLAAERDIAQVLGCRCRLELFVKVRPDWRNRPGILRSLGYR